MLFPTRPSQWDEPFGIVQLEAMAAGKALIASDLPAVRYLESEGLQVIRVPDETADAWATAIETLLTNPEKRKNMGIKNLAAAEKFDWSVIAEQYELAYKPV